MSSVAATHKSARQVLLEAARGVASLLAAYTIGFNIVHGVDKNQWWFPFALVVIAVLSTIFEGIYDEPVPGTGLGPMNLSNITCLFMGIGIPAVALICGALYGSWYWWFGALIALSVNVIFYFGSRQRGLPGVVVAVGLLIAAIT